MHAGWQERRPWDTILWWEYRRIPYNAALFVIGMISIALLEAIGGRLVPPGEDAVEPIALFLGTGIYAVAANICYSLGWITELLWNAPGADSAVMMARRAIVFKFGLFFSISLTALPGVISLLVWAASGFK